MSQKQQRGLDRLHKAHSAGIFAGRLPGRIQLRDRLQLPPGLHDYDILLERLHPLRHRVTYLTGLGLNLLS